MPNFASTNYILFCFIAAFTNPLCEISSPVCVFVEVKCWRDIWDLSPDSGTFYYYAQERNTFNVVGTLCYRPKLSGFLPWHWCNAIWRDTRLEYIMFLSKTWSSALWMWSNIQLLSQQKLHICHFSRQLPDSLLQGRTHFCLIHSGKVVSSELMLRNKNIKKTVPGV